MTAAQTQALGELLESQQWGAAQSLLEANGYCFLKEYESSPYSLHHVVHKSEGLKTRVDAMRSVYEQLTANGG